MTTFHSSMAQRLETFIALRRLAGTDYQSQTRLLNSVVIYPGLSHLVMSLRPLVRLNYKLYKYLIYLLKHKSGICSLALR